jgi:uncharacterized membrane protein HdeD (DUF308 family)
MYNALTRKWWVLLLNGLCAIAFGLLAFAWPAATLFALVILFAVYCLTDGVTAVAAAFARDEQGKAWGQMLFIGFVSIITGFVAVVWPGITALVLLTIIAIWAIVRGTFEITAAIKLRKMINNEWLLILAGAVSILFGLILLVHPGAGALALIWVIATFALVRGCLLVALSLRLRSLRSLNLPKTEASA